MYVDMRDDDMLTWDDAKLKEVVDQKHSGEKRRPTTDIVSYGIQLHSLKM